MQSRSIRVPMSCGLQKTHRSTWRRSESGSKVKPPSRNKPNQSLEPTAGRCEVHFSFYETVRRCLPRSPPPAVAELVLVRRQNAPPERCRFVLSPRVRPRYFRLVSGAARFQVPDSRSLFRGVRKILLAGAPISLSAPSHTFSAGCIRGSSTFCALTNR
jgi:hypothetical protein